MSCAVGFLQMWHLSPAESGRLTLPAFLTMARLADKVLASGPT